VAIKANRVCRLLAKQTEANESSAAVCWFITVIVMTEDARGYTGPVTFYNSQLMPLVGCHSMDALERLRASVMKSGWLEYTPGFNRRPAKYRVKIPEALADIDDGPSDEGAQSPADPLDKPRSNHRKNAEVPAVLDTGKPRSNHRKNAEVPAERTAARSAARTAAPPTFPFPCPKEEPPYPPQSRGEESVFDSLADVCGLDPTVKSAKRTLTRKAAELANAKPPYTAAEVREFGKRFWDLCPYARDKRERPTPNEVAKSIGLLRAKKKREAARRQQPAQPNNLNPTDRLPPGLIPKLHKISSEDRKRVLEPGLSDEERERRLAEAELRAKTKAERN
jgi:hypothetical protein